jgi:hypothetical protein
MENDENTPEVELDENKINEGESNEQSNDNSDTEEQVDWKAEALKQKAINKRISEKLNKPEVKKEVTGQPNTIGQKDLYALGQANVHIDDFDDVVEYAQFKKISIQEALKTDVIKTTLATKSEFRKTAEVSNTGPARRGAIKVSDEVLVKNLHEGKIPEKGSEEAERLFWARRGGKR